MAVLKVKSLVQISIQMISDQKLVHDGQMLLVSQLVGGTKVSKELLKLLMKKITEAAQLLVTIHLPTTTETVSLEQMEQAHGQIASPVVTVTIATQTTSTSVCNVTLVQLQGIHSMELSVSVMTIASIMRK